MTGQNRSSAVMQQRRAEGAERRSGRDVAPEALEYFPTPPWATRALCEFLAGQLGDLSALSCWEPCCGEGHMVGRCANISAKFGPATSSLRRQRP
jgi:hypothetical protein